MVQWLNFKLERLHRTWNMPLRWYELKMGEWTHGSFSQGLHGSRFKWKVSCAEVTGFWAKVLSNLFRFIVSYRENIYVIRNLFLEKRRNRTLERFYSASHWRLQDFIKMQNSKSSAFLAGSDKYIISLLCIWIGHHHKKGCVLINSSINPVSSEDCKGTHTHHSVHL